MSSRGILFCRKSYLQHAHHHLAYRVGDDVDPGFWAVACTGLHQRPNNTRIYVEELVASHTRLARNARRDHNEVAAHKCSSQLLIACERSHLDNDEADVVEDVTIGKTY